MYFREVGTLINKVDNRSIEKWLKKRDVDIYFDEEKYVIKTEFMDVYHKQFIDKLKKMYPENWFEVYTYHLNEDYDKINELKTSKKTNPINSEPLSVGAKERLEKLKKPSEKLGVNRNIAK